MNTLQVATIKAATIGTPTGRGGGAKAPSPADCMKDCIAWYSPKRQGITNEYLQDHYLDDDAVLQDLSGNGNNIALHNMEGEEGGGYVDENGDLVFDGVDDYGYRESFSLLGNSCVAINYFDDGLDTSPINRCIFDARLNNKAGIAMRRYSASNYYIDYADANNTGGWKSTTEEKKVVFNLPIGYTPYSIASPDLVVFSSNIKLYKAFENYPLAICAYLPISQNVFARYTLRELLFFRRNLTHEEAQWVYDNILTTDTNNSNS